MQKLHLQMTAFATLCILCGCSHGESDWRNAESQNTVGGYSSFLARYPKTSHSAEAQERLDWLTAKKTDSLHAYAQFNGQHPSSAFRQEAVRLGASKIGPAIQDLATRMSKWTDADRDLNSSILTLQPGNPYALLLRAVDQARQGKFDEARDALAVAGSTVKDERVSDLAQMCTVVQGGHTDGLEVVRPLWYGPEADQVREKTIRMAREAAAPPFMPDGRIIVPNGVCAAQQIMLDSSKGDTDLSGRLKCWIDYDTKSLKTLADRTLHGEKQDAEEVISVVRGYGADQACK